MPQPQSDRLGEGIDVPDRISSPPFSPRHFSWSVHRYGYRTRNNVLTPSRSGLHSVRYPPDGRRRCREIPCRYTHDTPHQRKDTGRISSPGHGSDSSHDGYRDNLSDCWGYRSWWHGCARWSIPQTSLPSAMRNPRRWSWRWYGSSLRQRWQRPYSWHKQVLER